MLIGNAPHFKRTYRQDESKLSLLVIMNYKVYFFYGITYFRKEFIGETRYKIESQCQGQCAQLLLRLKSKNEMMWNEESNTQFSSEKADQ